MSQSSASSSSSSNPPSLVYLTTSLITSFCTASAFLALYKSHHDRPRHYRTSATGPDPKRRGPYCSLAEAYRRAEEEVRMAWRQIEDLPGVQEGEVHLREMLLPHHQAMVVCVSILQSAAYAPKFQPLMLSDLLAAVYYVQDGALDVLYEQEVVSREKVMAKRSQMAQTAQILPIPSQANVELPGKPPSPPLTPKLALPSSSASSSTATFKTALQTSQPSHGNNNSLPLPSFRHLIRSSSPMPPANSGFNTSCPEALAPRVHGSRKDWELSVL